VSARSVVIGPDRHFAWASGGRKFAIGRGIYQDF
jgi:hypothetical protein